MSTPGHAMAHPSCASTVGAVKYGENYNTALWREGWSSSAALTGRGRVPSVKHLHQAWHMSSISPRIVPRCPGYLSYDPRLIPSPSQGEKPEESASHLWQRCRAWW